MNSTPLISVIVITYNQQSTIRRTLDSILMQQCHAPFEIVVGNDCSTDGTLAVCEEFRREHPDVVRVIDNAQNKGPANNYFDCMLQCRGELIADCAGDDFWTDPAKLEKELAIMERHPGVTLVHTAWQSYDERTGLTHPSPPQPFPAAFTSGRSMLKAILCQLRMPVIHLCTSLYRKQPVLEALESDEYMFRNPEFGCEDLQVCVAEALSGDIAYIPDVTLSYSQGHESVSASSDYRRLFLFTRRVTSLSNYMACKYNVDIGEFLSQRVFALGMHAFRLHDRQLLAEVLDCERQWHAPRTAKVSILLFVLRHDVLWLLALALRKCFTALKRLLRRG